MESFRSDLVVTDLRSSQSCSGRASTMTYRHTQYPSASAALKAYITDYESQHESETPPTYRRTVNDLLLPRTTLQRTAERSLDTGVRDTKNEFHRFNIRKLIDDSYEQLLRADLEQGPAYASSALEEPSSYPPRRRSPVPLEDDASISETQTQFSDLASEISSSTDALLLANPYSLPSHHRDNRYKPASRLKQMPDAETRGSVYGTHRKINVNTPRGVSSAMLRDSGRSVSSRLARDSVREFSRSLPGGRRQQASARAYSSLPYTSQKHPVSSRKPPHSQNLRASVVRARQVDSNEVRSMSSREVRSVLSSKEVRSVSSREERRPIPAWVNELDATVDGQGNNLSTLYVDSLLGEDGLPPTPQTHLRRSHADSSSNRMSSREAPEAQTSHLSSPESVMSGIRPAPTWVEDLDVTTSILPASLRLLAEDMDPNVASGPPAFQGELTQRSSRSGLSDPKSIELSKPGSLRSEVQKPGASNRNSHSLRPSQNGRIRTTAITSTDKNYETVQGDLNRQKHHTRTQSASTEDLIEESPFGDGTSRLTTSVPQLHRRTKSGSTEDLINESPFGDETSRFISSVPQSLQNGKHSNHLSRVDRGVSNSARVSGRTNDKHGDRLEFSTRTLMQNGKSSLKGSHGQHNTQLRPPHTVPNSQSLGAASTKIHNRLDTRTRLQPQKAMQTGQTINVTSKMFNHLDTSTTTDSLIYSSPFGLDRDQPLSDHLGQPSHQDHLDQQLSPIGSEESNGTMKEDEIASLSTLSSLTLKDRLGVGLASVGDCVSETTVGETARANAMLQRAQRAVENTGASLNASSHFEPLENSLDSSATEELLAGDQDIMSKLKAEIRAHDSTARDPAVQQMMDQFLDDCLNSSGQKSPDLPSDQASEGPLESLKNMLFQLQDMASQHTLGTEALAENQQPRGNLSQRNKIAGEATSVTACGVQLSSIARQPQPTTPHSSLGRQPHHSAQHPTVPFSTQHRLPHSTLTRSTQPQRATSSTPPVATTSRSRGATSGEKPSVASPGAMSALSSSGATSHPTANVSFQSQRSFDDEPGGKSMQRAMQHLSRLKHLVSMDTASSSPAST